ncbi:hypothetical protein RFI_16958, partial [Reticulomyxa filosa]
MLLITDKETSFEVKKQMMLNEARKTLSSLASVYEMTAKEVELVRKIEQTLQHHETGAMHMAIKDVKKKEKEEQEEDDGNKKEQNRNKMKVSYDSTLSALQQEEKEKEEDDDDDDNNNNNNNNNNDNDDDDEKKEILSSEQRLTYEGEWCFPVVALVSSDVELLRDVAMGLKNWNSNSARGQYAIYELQSVVLNDFPAEVCLQKNTRVLASALHAWSHWHALATHERVVATELALRFLRKLVAKLQESLNLLCDPSVMSIATFHPNVSTHIDSLTSSSFKHKQEHYNNNNNDNDNDNGDDEYTYDIAYEYPQSRKDISLRKKKSNIDDGDEHKEEEDEEEKKKVQAISKDSDYSQMHSLTEFVHRTLCVLYGQWLPHSSSSSSSSSSDDDDDNAFSVLAASRKLVDLYYFLKKHDKVHMTQCSIQSLLQTLLALQPFYKGLLSCWPRPHTTQEWFVVEVCRITIRLIQYLPHHLVLFFFFFVYIISVLRIPSCTDLDLDKFDFAQLDDDHVPESISTVLVQLLTQHIELSSTCPDLKSEALDLLRFLRPSICNQITYAEYVMQTLNELQTAEITANNLPFLRSVFVALPFDKLRLQEVVRVLFVDPSQ